eukprot:scaffold11885_cov129-Isochrysis_galbana.AAC.13
MLRVWSSPNSCRNAERQEAERPFESSVAARAESYRRKATLGWATASRVSRARRLDASAREELAR